MHRRITVEHQSCVRRDERVVRSCGQRDVTQDGTCVHRHGQGQEPRGGRGPEHGFTHPWSGLIQRGQGALRRGMAGPAHAGRHDRLGVDEHDLVACDDEVLPGYVAGTQHIEQPRGHADAAAEALPFGPGARALLADELGPCVAGPLENPRRPEPHDGIGRRELAEHRSPRGKVRRVPRPVHGPPAAAEPDDRDAPALVDVARARCAPRRLGRRVAEQAAADLVEVTGEPDGEVGGERRPPRPHRPEHAPQHRVLPQQRLPELTAAGACRYRGKCAGAGERGGGEGDPVHQVARQPFGQFLPRVESRRGRQADRPAPPGHEHRVQQRPRDRGLPGGPRRRRRDHGHGVHGWA